MYTPKIVYVANAKTKAVDSWLCVGEMRAKYQGKFETLCLLSRNKESCVLPKRCCFETKYDARAALNRK